MDWTNHLYLAKECSQGGRHSFTGASYLPPGPGRADAAGLWVGGEGGNRIGVDET